MKAKYGNQIVDVWEIGQATPKPRDRRAHV